MGLQLRLPAAHSVALGGSVGRRRVFYLVVRAVHELLASYCDCRQCPSAVCVQVWDFKANSCFKHLLVACTEKHSQGNGSDSLKR